MERFAAINDRYVSFLKSEISMHLFCYPGFTCGAVDRCNNSTNPIRYSNCYSSSRLSVGLFSRESSFTGTCTPSGACASYSSTAGSTISPVRTHSFVPSTLAAACGYASPETASAGTHQSRSHYSPLSATHQKSAAAPSVGARS